MQSSRLFPLVLVFGLLVSGCGAPEPPMACFEDQVPWKDRGAPPGMGHHFKMCEHFGMVCNEAVTLADECPEFMAELLAFLQEEILPRLSRIQDFLPWLDLDEMLSWIVENLQGACGYIDILDRVGTCQQPGQAGDPCAEDADCEPGLLCLEGVCG